MNAWTRWTACLAGALVAAGSASAAAEAAIQVKSTDDAEVVRFAKLSCRVDQAGFHGRATVKGWRLVARIQPFRGFRTYPLEYGLDKSAATFFLDPPGGGETFSNVQVPPTDIPRLTLGGAIHFPGGRTRIRIDFPIAYDRSDRDPNIVTLTGGAKCAYPRRR